MKKIALVLFAAALVSGSAFAQLDPDDDGIGVYFDPCACSNCVSMDVGPNVAYVVITHPTSPQGVFGWEAEVTMEGPAFLLNFDLIGQTVNVGTPPEYIVGITEPQINPYKFPAIVIAVLDIFISDTSAPVNFFIDGIRFHSLPNRVPAYLDGADPSTIKELRQATGGPDIPVSTINGDCAVAIENESWGGVKALYR
jgi:hypothetical protein